MGWSDGLGLFGVFRGTGRGLGLFERLLMTGLCLTVAGLSTGLGTLETETLGGV